MAKQNLFGIGLLILGFVFGITGLIFFLPLGWLLLGMGIIAIVYGRDMRVGVKGNFAEHLSGKKFREHKKSKKK